MIKRSTPRIRWDGLGFNKSSTVRKKPCTNPRKITILKISILISVMLAALSEFKFV
jgi:hypothetical protein